jgi:phage shock protein PspC (stress-responsive transcriptional regulator)
MLVAVRARPAVQLRYGTFKKNTKIRKLKNMNEKLYRRNGYVGGVCQGLGEWSGIPSILWRVGFLFFIPAAFWVYVVLWMVLKKNY